MVIANEKVNRAGRALPRGLLPRDWAIAERLVAWLNDPDPAKANAQREVEDTMGLLRTKGLGPTTAEKPVLHKFRQVPIHWNGWWDEFGYVVAPLLDPKTETQFGLWLLSDVTRAHLFGNVRSCKQCERWFVARREQKSFCSSACQRKSWDDYRRTPEGRKYENKRIRRWRAQQRKSTGGKKR